MKFINSILKRKFKTFTIMTFLVTILVTEGRPHQILAAENTVETSDSTTYFINDQEFSFTGYNLGYEFYIPKRCNCRMLVAVIPEDRANEDITINIKYSGGGTTHSKKIATNKAAVYIFNDVGAGGHNLEYIGRSGVKYTIRISLYTWDY